jgi:glucose-6-phosphate 1-dehydrogenase
MESPVSGNSESINDQKLQVFKSIAPIHPDDAVFGQYDGYLSEKNVDPQSTTPTFLALRLSINNWRWFGVPFYIRAGKKLARRVTEVVIQFRTVPLCALENEALCQMVESNRLIIRIQPDEGIRLTISVKSPELIDRITPVNLEFNYNSLSDELPDAYQRVILDGLHGISTLFWRSDALEAAWKLVDPLLTIQPNNGKPYPYAQESWGPGEAMELLKRDGRMWMI